MSREEDEEGLFDEKKGLSRADDVEDDLFDFADEGERGLGIEDPVELLRGSELGTNRLGRRGNDFEEHELGANFETDDRKFSDLGGENEGLMAARGSGSRGSLGSLGELVGLEETDMLRRIRELGSQVMGNANDDRWSQEEELANLEGSERVQYLSENGVRNQNLGNYREPTQTDFISLDEIVRGADRENLQPSMSPRDAQQLGETYVMQLNNALGTEFEVLVSEYLSSVDGLLGADFYEIQQRVETGVVNANGNQRFVIPDMMLFRDGELTNVLEMKVGLNGLKVKDIEYVADHFSEAAVKFVFLKSSEDKVEECEALEGLVDEYLDRNEIVGNSRLIEKGGILSRMEVWNMDDVVGLLPEDRRAEFIAKSGRISELSFTQNEDYIAAYNSFNRLVELTDELKELVCSSTEGENESGRDLIERSISLAVDGDNAYQNYINMAILQKVVAEKAIAPGDLQNYLGLAENTTLSYTNPMVASGIIQHTEIYPGTVFLYFRDEDRPTYYDTLKPEPKGGFELMQSEGILRSGEITHYDVAEILGDRPQRKATVFNLFNFKSVIGEKDIAEIINESHLESTKMADREMKWMFNRGMINREQLSWHSGHCYYWLRSRESPDFSEIRKFMDDKMIKSIEFIENKANYRFNNFNDFRKYFSIANSNASLEKSWREGLKILSISEELQTVGRTSFNVDEIRNLYNKSTDSNITSRTIEGRLKILVNAKILLKTDISYALNNELSQDDIESKINSFAKVKILNYSNSNFQLDITLKHTKQYALDKLKDLGFEREQIIELKGSGQKIHYLLNKGDIDIFHAGSLMKLFPEYKEKTITEGLRKLAKMDLLDRFSVPKNLKSTGHVITYYKPKGQEEATFFDLK